MELNMASEITDLWRNNRKIDALRLFRSETHMDLGSAKRYLEVNEPDLLDKLCSDFVQSKEDLLIKAKHDRKVLDVVIETLEWEIEQEKAGRDIDHLTVPMEVIDAVETRAEALRQGLDTGAQ